MEQLELEVLAHRYLYYVLARPILTDYQYDILEAKAKAHLKPESSVHLVGSDLASDYPKEVIDCAKNLTK